MDRSRAPTLRQLKGRPVQTHLFGSTRGICTFRIRGTIQEFLVKHIIWATMPLVDLQGMGMGLATILCSRTQACRSCYLDGIAILFIVIHWTNISGTDTMIRAIWWAPVMHLRTTRRPFLVIRLSSGSGKVRSQVFNLSPPNGHEQKSTCTYIDPRKTRTHIDFHTTPNSCIHYDSHAHNHSQAQEHTCHARCRGITRQWPPILRLRAVTSSSRSHAASAMV